MTTDTDLDPLDALVLYSHRFKIETGFRHAIHVLGSYAYHFWMERWIRSAGEAATSTFT